MDLKQIEKYEYSKEYLKLLKKWENSLPFSNRYHGGGSHVPSIENEIEFIHVAMYEKVMKSLCEAEEKIEDIIRKI